MRWSSCPSICCCTKVCIKILKFILIKLFCLQVDGVILKISFRQKTAGKREAKKVSGLNFEEIKKRLISEGIDPTAEEIKARMLDEGYLVISEKQKNIINSIDISESAKKRVNEVESALIVIGAVLCNESEYDAKSDIEVFDWYLETFELQPGKLGISDGDIKDIISIKKVYEKIYSEVAGKKRKSDETANETSNDDYLSNEIVYDLGEGWRVVYVPAAGEMEPYPGYSNTSHDRVLEGDKNGLCLGSGARYYQNNQAGKIYSVRDPGNKPRVTIRIDRNILQEAKGKNNNPPDILAAIKANDWFKTIEGLNYKEAPDYRSFPPLNIYDAKESFTYNKYQAYKDGWVPHWYNNGIAEIDEDIEEKIKLYDEQIITAGFGKYPKFFEKIKPVVIYWCNNYLNGSRRAEEIIFLSNENHEIFKTYKKLPEMQLAVKKLSESDKAHNFLVLNLHKIKEYEKYIKNPAERFVEINPKIFIERYSDEPWAEVYLNKILGRLINSTDYSDYEFIVEKLFNKNFVKEYLERAINNMIFYDSEQFLANLHKYSYINKLDPKNKDKLINKSFKNLNAKGISNILYRINENKDPEVDYENKDKFDKILINKFLENIEYIKNIFYTSPFGDSSSILDFCKEISGQYYKNKFNEDSYDIREELLDFIYKKSISANNFKEIFDFIGKLLSFYEDMSLLNEKNLIKKIKLISLALLKNISSKYIPADYLVRNVWDFINNIFNIVENEVVVDYTRLIINKIKNYNPSFFLKTLYIGEVSNINSDDFHWYERSSFKYSKDFEYIKNKLKEELCSIPDKKLLIYDAKAFNTKIMESIFYLLDNKKITKKNHDGDALIEVFEKNYKQYIEKADEKIIENLFIKIKRGEINGQYLVDFFNNKNNLEPLIYRCYINYNGDFMRLFYKRDFEEIKFEPLVEAIKDNAKNILKIYNDKYRWILTPRIKELFKNQYTKSFLFHENLELLKQISGLDYIEKKSVQLNKYKKLLKLSEMIKNIDYESYVNIKNLI